MAGVHAAGQKTDRTIVVEGPGRVAVRDEPRAPVPTGAFRVTTVFSGISADTELSYVKGTNPFLSERWDPGLGLFVPGEPNVGYPVTRLGYMEVGTVAESRTPVIGVGGTVAMTYGHRTGYTGDPVADRVVPVPEDLDPLLGIYVAHMARSASTACCTPPRSCAGPTSARSATECAADASWWSAPGWRPCLPRCWPAGTAPPPWWCSTRLPDAGRWPGPWGWSHSTWRDRTTRPPA
jgi:hypothetical protein